MLIYLDANIVQYCADYGDFICGNVIVCPVKERKLQRELCAIRKLIQLEQFGNWTFAAPEHLLAELNRGRPSGEQRATYALLKDSASPECEIDPEVFRDVMQELLPLRLRGRADREHLATAVSLGASWFLTNDNGIIRRARKIGGRVHRTQVAKPSACIEEIGVGLFVR